MRYLLLITIMLFLTVNCTREQQPLYQGLPLKVWMERLGAPEPEVRKDALEIIIDIGKPARLAERSVVDIARNDQYPDIRYTAVEALRSMGASTYEFDELVEEFNAPTIPIEEENLEGEIDELSEHSSGEDDFAYLKDLIDGTLESHHSRSDTVPTDSASMKNLVQDMQDEDVTVLLNQLQHPAVLARLLKLGNVIEKRFAASMLSEIEGSNDTILEILNQARFDSDSLVAESAEKAYQHWK